MPKPPTAQWIPDPVWSAFLAASGPFVVWLTVGLYDEPGERVCPSCGDNELIRRGYARTMVGKYIRYQCGGCGAWSRAPEQVLDKTHKNNVMRRVA